MRPRLVVAILAGALALVGLTPAMAPLRASAEAAKLGEDADLAHWREEVAKARDRVSAAQRELADAEYAYQDVRQRKRRGEEKAAAVARLEAAKKELAAAEAALPDVVEKARRAGLPPGEFRELDVQR